ncbi:hypothetical protein D3Z50_21745, partial [Clostridiaceae bacterium]|nr:hypothetical protein [Clostridiaceae bacterium]
QFSPVKYETGNLIILLRLIPQRFPVIPVLPHTGSGTDAAQAVQRVILINLVLIPALFQQVPLRVIAVIRRFPAFFQPG